MTGIPSEPIDDAARPLDDLNLLRTFVAAAEGGSFTAAAERLGVTRPQVSLQVQRLEAALGARLFNRTTRRVALTERGQRLFEDCAPPVRALRDAVAADEGDRPVLRGRLRISAAVDPAVQVLAPAVAAFAALHPGLRIELSASDKVVDLVAEGVDVAVRMGWLRDGSLRATQLGRFAQGVLASPAYLRRHGTPAHPQDLAAHAWIALTLLPTPLTWSFRGADGSAVTVRMAAQLRTDSPSALRALLLQGAGLSVASLLDVAAELDAGTLVRVLPDWQLPDGGIFAVFPPGRHIPASSRAFTAFLRERLTAVSAP